MNCSLKGLGEVFVLWELDSSSRSSLAAALFVVLEDNRQHSVEALFFVVVFISKKGETWFKW